MTVSVTWITARVCVVTWWYASKHMKRAGDVRMCLARSVQSPVHFESKTDTCDCDGLKFTAGLISHWDSGCTCRTGRFWTYARSGASVVWSVNIYLSSSYLIWPHLHLLLSLSHPFARSQPPSFLYCCTLMHHQNDLPHAVYTAVCWLVCRLILHIWSQKQQSNVILVYHNTITLLHNVLFSCLCLVCCDHTSLFYIYKKSTFWRRCNNTQIWRHFLTCEWKVCDSRRWVWKQISHMDWQKQVQPDQCTRKQGWNKMNYFMTRSWILLTRLDSKGLILYSGCISTLAVV